MVQTQFRISIVRSNRVDVTHLHLRYKSWVSYFHLCPLLQPIKRAAFASEINKNQLSTPFVANFYHNHCVKFSHTHFVKIPPKWVPFNDPCFFHPKIFANYPYQGIVGCTPNPNMGPLWRIPISALYYVGIYGLFHPQESLVIYPPKSPTRPWSFLEEQCTQPRWEGWKLRFIRKLRERSGGCECVECVLYVYFMYVYLYIYIYVYISRQSRYDSYRNTFWVNYKWQMDGTSWGWNMRES